MPTSASEALQARPQPLLLVTGMHRSGTSLLARVLQRLGVALPGELIAADLHNPTGYFERSDVTALQEELLLSLDRWWATEAGLQPLPPRWMESAEARRASQRLEAILAGELARQQGPWAIKDPRLCRLLPLWRPLIRRLGIPVQVVVSLRDPEEVCVSLLRRDGPLVGMDLERAEQLWCLHNQELLRHAANLPCHWVDYGEWFRQPRNQLEALARALRLSFTEESIAEALAAIEPAHRRSDALGLPRPVSPAVRRLYDELRIRSVAKRPSWRHQLGRGLRRLKGMLPACN